MTVKELQAQLATVKAALNLATQALTAEREKGQTLTGASWYDQEMRQLRNQLAAEREKAQQRANEGTKWYLEAKAERHKREACEVLIRDLQKELAAPAAAG